MASRSELEIRQAARAARVDAVPLRWRTSLVPEAEPLMRGALAILVDFEHRTGHRHPDRDFYAASYASLLKAMGKNEAEACAAIDELMRKLL
jgi:hypothetical protein